MLQTTGAHGPLPGTDGRYQEEYFNKASHSCLVMLPGLSRYFMFMFPPSLNMTASLKVDTPLKPWVFEAQRLQSDSPKGALDYHHQSSSLLLMGTQYNVPSQRVARVRCGSRALQQVLPPGSRQRVATSCWLQAVAQVFGMDSPLRYVSGNY